MNKLLLWQEKLCGRLPAEMPYDGAIGEYQFVRRLTRSPAESSFVIYRLQQRPGDDLDVTVVGPKGVWVFEVKYWSGTIGWRNGRWFRVKSRRGAGGARAPEPVEVGQPPDQQWRRMTHEVEQTLRFRVPWLVARLPSLTRIRGGVVFTHPGASYDVAPDCPFEWGPIVYWVQQLGRAAVVPGLNERVVLQVLDALLARHREVAETGALLSMDVHAARLVQETEARLAEWVQDRVA